MSNILSIKGYLSGSPFLSPFKIGSSAITARLYRKVNPIDVRLLLYQQFIEIFVIQVADIEQYRCVAQGLFNADTSDIYCAAC